MKIPLFFIITLLATSTILSTQTAQAAPHNPNATVATINNQNTTLVYVDVRRTTDLPGTNCMPEMILSPGAGRVIDYGELQPRCQADTQFLVDAYGDTHTIVHTALLNNTPGNCTIVHKLFSIAISCQP